MHDYAHRFTEKEIAALEKEVAAVYKQATTEAEEKLNDYFKRFATKDKIWAAKVANGERTAAEYAQWRQGQLIVGARWKAMSDKLAEEYHKANVIARDIALGHRAAVYAENFNFATYGIEKAAKVNTSFTVYSRESVERVVRDQPELLPPPGKRMKKTLKQNPDIAWQKGQIQSVTMQSILQGESIPNMAKRIAQTMGEQNHGSTIRYARTAMTGAQNAGRIDAYKRAESLGIDIEQQWIATLDGRTRFEHRQLDGQTAKVGEPFKVDGYEIMFPGDPTADAEMIWNCRCTTIAVVNGISHDLSRRAMDESLGDMSYSEWKESHKSISHSITKQEEISEAMKGRYIRELYGGESGATTDYGAENEKLSIPPSMSKEQYTEWQKEFSSGSRYESYFKDKYGITRSEAVNSYERDPISGKWYDEIGNRATHVLMKPYEQIGECGYVQNADGSRAINKYLRSGEVGKLYSKSDMEDVISCMKELSDKTTIPQEIVVDRWTHAGVLEKMGIDIGDHGKVYRIGHAFCIDGLDYERIEENVRKNLVGSVITDRGFMSTSACSELNVFTGSDVKFTIVAPKGTNAFITDNIRESEVVFMPGTKQEVIGVNIIDSEAFDHDKNGTKRKSIEIILRIVGQQ